MDSKAKVFYKASAEKDLRGLGHAAAGRILKKLEKDLSDNPHKGLPLKGEFEGLFKYRIGDYRVIYTKISEGILILRIGHRKEIYR